MLTVEILRQNSALAGLTDAQLTAISEMSQNDENAVIGAKIGALHGQYDADIFSITGIAKNSGEKSYDYAKRVLAEFKTQAGSTTKIQAELDKAKTKITELNQKIANGEGDAALKQQLKDTKTQVAQLQAQLQSKETEYTKTKESLEQQIKDVHVSYAFAEATQGLKFKEGISDTVKNVLLAAAKEDVLRKGSIDFVDNTAGGKDIVLRDANGIILNNPNNGLRPYTIKELVLESPIIKDSLETQRKASGGGTGPIVKTEDGKVILDLSIAKTQVDADKMIESYLLSNGLTRDSVEFAEQSMQLRNDNNVSAMPIR